MPARSQPLAGEGVGLLPAHDMHLASCAQNAMWTVFVSKTSRQCKLEPLDGGSGPTVAAAKRQQPAAADFQQSPSSPAAAHLSAHHLHFNSNPPALKSRTLQQWTTRPPLTYVRHQPARSAVATQCSAFAHQAGACLQPACKPTEPSSFVTLQYLWTNHHGFSSR